MVETHGGRREAIPFRDVNLHVEFLVAWITMLGMVCLSPVVSLLLFIKHLHVSPNRDCNRGTHINSTSTSGIDTRVYCSSQRQQPSMKYVNYAAWVPSPNASLEVETAPFPQPDGLAADELIIKNKAVAINPVDWKIQSWPGNRFGLSYPYILGEDVAGEVLYAGAGVKDLFAKGDRVLAYSMGIGAGDAAYGGFQLFVKLKAITAAKVPDGLTFEEAAVLPLSVSTAAAGLYLTETLGLRLPRVPGSSVPIPLDTSKETLLLWGGSSSVGSSVVQLAVASGYSVVATASPSNYGYVKNLGVSLVLDYHNPDIVPILVQLLQHRQTTVVGAYDAIGTEVTVRQTAAVLQALGGGKIASVGVAPTDVGEGKVQVARISAANITTQEPEVARTIWGKYVPAALKIGQLLPRPRELVLGKGLYYVQGGLDLNKKGISAAKVVVTL